MARSCGISLANVKEKVEKEIIVIIIIIIIIIVILIISNMK